MCRRRHTCVRRVAKGILYVSVLLNDYANGEEDDGDKRQN